MSQSRDLAEEVSRLALDLQKLTLDHQRTKARVEQLEQEIREFKSEGYEVVVDPSVSLSASTLSPSGRVDKADPAARGALARQIGQFLRRALAGEFRGTSGRDRLNLQNRCYVVAADYLGTPINPPRFETQFAVVRDLCRRGQDPGRSVFVGFATKWEARIAVEEAGLIVPVSLRDA